MYQSNIIKCSKLTSYTEIELPASKSISNRAIIINALAGDGGKLHNLSTARDTQTMLKLIDSPEKTWDVKDAGTTMRFLTAYAAATNQNKLMTGTERMQQRPIGLLIDALRSMGAEIDYKGKAGFPPHEIIDFSNQKTSQISIRGDVSSQYISALLMIAPTLPQGLRLTLTDAIGSLPYIEMTLSLMKKFGATCEWTESTIKVNPQEYSGTELTVEPDWSAASYWYSFVALSDNSSVLLSSLTEESLQGDSVLKDFMAQLGVKTTFTQKGALLEKQEHATSFEYDFTHSPDLAQTVAVLCAAKGIKVKFTGLQSLKIKETDRIAALQTELGKIGAHLIEEGETWVLKPSRELPASAFFQTYEDHRMAMALAPLCLLMDVAFDDTSVVAKSYPHFWKDVEKALV